MAPAASLESAMRATRSLPCAPALLPKLLAMIQSDDSDAREMERLVLTDPGLAAGLLRLANSAYFGSSRRCDNVSEAILRLGSTTLYRLAATIVAGRWLVFPTGSGYGWQPGDLCRHSVCVAIAAEVYAQRNQLAPSETAYTAGLLLDVGKLALAFTNGEALAEVARRVQESNRPWREVEQEVLGFTSVDIARELLSSWGFPESLTAAAAHYDKPSLAPAAHRPLVVLVHAAKNIAIELGYGVGVDGFFTAADEELLASFGFDDETLHEAVPEILERVQRFISPDGKMSDLASAPEIPAEPAPAA